MNEEQNAPVTPEANTSPETATEPVSSTALTPWEIVATAFSRSIAQPKLWGWFMLMYIASFVLMFVCFALAGAMVFTAGLAPVGVLIGLVGFLGGIALSFGCGGAVLYCVAKEQESFWDGWKLFWPNFWQFMVLGLITTLVLATGFALLIIPAFALMVYILFSQMVFAKEDLRGTAVLVRSTELVHGAWWATFGRFLLVLFPFFALGVVFGFLSEIFGEGVQIIFQLMQGFLAVYFVHAMYLMYEWRVAAVPVAAEHSSWTKGYKIASWFGVFAILLMFIVPVVFALQFAQDRAMEKQQELILQQMKIDMEIDKMMEEIEEVELEIESSFDTPALSE